MGVLGDGAGEGNQMDDVGAIDDHPFADRKTFKNLDPVAITNTKPYR